MSTHIDATSKNCADTALKTCEEVQQNPRDRRPGDRLERLLARMARLLDLEGKSQFK